MADEHPAQDSAGVFQASMEAALAQLDAVRAELARAQEKAIDDQLKARDELARIQRESETLAKQYFDEHRKELVEDLRQDLHRGMLRQLILWGIPSLWVRSALDVAPEILTEIWMDLGFEKCGDHAAHVSYAQEGRGGYVIFHREDLVLRWWWEFGGSEDVVAIISIPTAEKWEASTRIPLAERQEVLDFVGRRVVRDQAFGGSYSIGEQDILIRRSSTSP